jgi:hypothetical protein
MEKIARRLGDDPDPEIPPRKPKWMRTATYDRLLGAWHEVLAAPGHAFGSPRPSSRELMPSLRIKKLGRGRAMTTPILPQKAQPPLNDR